MNNDTQTLHGFGQATGRMHACPACRKPLPLPQNDQLVLVCATCRTETKLSPPLVPLEGMAPSLKPLIDAAAVSDQKIAAEMLRSDRDHMVANLLDDDFELKLEPESERSATVTSLIGLQIASSDSVNVTGGSHRSPVATQMLHQLDSESRVDQAKQTYNDSAGYYPRERHYPTLEAMQRLYRLFGYVAILCVFPYVGMRLLYLIVVTRDKHLQVMAEFTEFAVPLLFGCTAVAATLFALSEGIKLAMDIQDNTLRIANSSGRSKPT
jgi:hypothetical protein